MTTPITVASLVAQCAREGVDPEAAVLLVEEEGELRALVESDFTYGQLGSGARFEGFLLAAPSDEFAYED